jgi:hypothetical protein
MGKHNLPTIKGSAAPALCIAGAAMVLLLTSIVFRSLVGHAASHACPKETAVLFGLAAAGCLGKMSGGLLSDKLGWKKVSVAALVLSAPLIAFGGSNPIIIGLGGGLFQITMPVSLVAAAAILPNRPSLVFGLNCLAYIGGAFPIFLGLAVPYYGSTQFLLVILAAIGAVWGGLHLLTPRVAMRFATSGTERERCHGPAQS